MNNEQSRTSNATRNEAENQRGGDDASTGARRGVRPIQAAGTNHAPRPPIKRSAPNRSQRSFAGMSPGLLAGLIGVGAGLTATYFLNSNRGGQRRALIGDKLSSAANRLPSAMSGAATDISNRARGMWAGATNLFTSDNPSDQVLEARVRSKMGRVVSHPSSIHVMARDGRVTLDGVILAHEVPALLASVEKVRGVQDVENNLQVHQSPGGVPGLQGGGSQREQQQQQQQWGSTQENWSPAARIGAGALGLGLSAIGATMIARSFASTGTGQHTGGAIKVYKSINVNAPRDVLFALWSNFENFPKFMSNVLEIRNIDDRRSHWRVAGPAGIPVQWEAEITKIVPDELIAWRSIEGSMVENAGYVLFEPNGDDSTEVSVHLSYNPPAGAIGHAVAKLFGADPKSEMDQDLMRMKSMLETGQFPHDAAQPINHNRTDHIH